MAMETQSRICPSCESAEDELDVLREEVSALREENTFLRRQRDAVETVLSELQEREAVS